MIERINLTRSIQGIEKHLANERALGKAKLNDSLLSRRRHPPIVKYLSSFAQMVWEWIKSYFLFWLFNPEQDAAREAANQLNLFFNRFLDAQRKPNDENKKKIQAEFEKLPTELQNRIKDNLLLVIKEQILPQRSLEQCKSTLEKILKDPFKTYENDKGHEPSVMGQAIAKAIQSYHIII